MSAHTPGPWEQSRTFGQQGLIGPRDGFPVASVTGYYTRNGQSEANALLIAAAPDLLSSLIASANYIDTLGGNSKSYRQVIAKATGEQP